MVSGNPRRAPRHIPWRDVPHFSGAVEGLILLFRDESLLARFERSNLALGLVIYPLNGYPT